MVRMSPKNSGWRANMVNSIGRLGESAYTRLRMCLVGIVLLCVLTVCARPFIEHWIVAAQSSRGALELEARRAILLSSIHKAERRVGELQKELSVAAVQQDYENSVAELPRILSELATLSGVQLNDISRHGNEAGSGARYGCRTRGDFVAITDFIERISKAETRFVLSELSFKNASWPVFDGLLEVSIEVRIA